MSDIDDKLEAMAQLIYERGAQVDRFVVPDANLPFVQRYFDYDHDVNAFVNRREHRAAAFRLRAAATRSRRPSRTSDSE